MKPIKYNLEERLICFATQCIDFIEAQPQRLAVRLLANQLIKSCSSVALNYGEVMASESARDFNHKMKVCLKELRETIMTLRILEKRKYVDQAAARKLVNENDQLIRIFVASLRTAKRNQEHQH